MAQSTTKPDAKQIIREFNENHQHRDNDCLFVQRLRAVGLNDDQVAGVLEAYDSVCRTCLDSDCGCYCPRDD